MARRSREIGNVPRTRQPTVENPVPSSISPSQRPIDWSCPAKNAASPPVPIETTGPIDQTIEAGGLKP
jgi:hypothetical protein